MNIQAQQVLDYWFGTAPAADGLPVAELRQRWFSGGKPVDAEIKAQFGDLVVQALRGHCDHWCGQARTELALVLLLDQFTRNIYRGQPAAFAGDAQARTVVCSALASGRDRELNPVERSFFYLPLEHSEDLADQAQAVALFEALAVEAPSALADYLAKALDYAHQHQDIILRFGRFPHRNAVLGRPHSKDETDWLAQDSRRFGQ